MSNQLQESHDDERQREQLVQESYVAPVIDQAQTIDKAGENAKGGLTLQGVLDGLCMARVNFGVWLVYLSLRMLSIEVSLDEVRNQSYDPEEQSTKLDFTHAKDAETLLATAKEGFVTSEERRTTVVDKSKTLLTLGSLFLALVAFLLPKDLAYSSIWLRGLVVGTVLFFLHAVVLLLLFFMVGKGTEVHLDQVEIGLTRTRLQLSLAKSYIFSRNENDRRTDYLVDVFKAARFSIFAAFVLATALFSLSFAFQNPGDQTKQIVETLRADPKLLDTLRGPKGESGPTGASGPAGKDAAEDLDLLSKKVAELLKEKTAAQQSKKMHEGGALGGSTVQRIHPILPPVIR